jgi:hypothetical protein
MYAYCHLCRHGLGRNTLIAHMPIGGRLAYDPERGRLWVVCSACGDWNLTPLEERWEAIAECERHFQAAEARASRANVGVSRLSGLDLIRIGPALRDEVANWRYGPRLDRRRRRARVTAGATGVVGLAAVGGAAALGVLSSGFAIGLWGTALAASYVVPLLAPLARRIGSGRDITFVDPGGAVLRIPYAAVHRVTLTRRERRRGAPRIGVQLPAAGGEAELHEDRALFALGALLPRMNWRGARPSSIRHATELLDRAEERTSAPVRGARKGHASAWEWLAVAYWPRDGALDQMTAVPRLALEMAVSEALEQQAMAGEAHVLGARWREAETVAAIADDMFLPDSIRDWLTLRRQAARQSGPPHGTA